MTVLFGTLATKLRVGDIILNRWASEDDGIACKAIGVYLSVI